MQRSTSDDDLFERVKRAFERNITCKTEAGLDNPKEVPHHFSRIVSAVKAAYRTTKLPFDDPSDPGARLEHYLIEGQFKQLLRDDHILLKDQKAREAAEQREELREAAWLAAGQHGFSALAGLPELQQVIAYTCIDALDRSVEDSMFQLERNEADRREFMTRVGVEESLLSLLAPQLRVCLLAEVAAGMLCPGQPLPPDTAEHGAALLEFIEEARHCVTREAADSTKQPPQMPTYRGRSVAHLGDEYTSLVRSHGFMQLHVAGHQLLDMVCQLMEQLDSNNNSSGGSGSGGSGISDAAAAGTHSQAAAAATSNEQLEALHKLLHHWQLQFEMCRELQQHAASGSGCGASSNYLAAGGAVVQQCINACLRVLQDPSFQVAAIACVPSAACVAADLLHVACDADQAESMQHRLQRQDDELPSYARPSAVVLAEQLRVLAGGLVLQFLRQACAAGGPAWQQEVPLQALLLFAAVEQLQGMVAAAVSLQDVQLGFSAAVTAVHQEAQQAAAAVVKHQQQGVSNGVRLKKIAVAASSDDEAEEDQFEDCRQQQEHQQQPCEHAQQPSKQLLLAVHKVLDLIQLIRHFTAINEAVNSSPGAASSGGSSSRGSAASAGGQLSLAALCAVGGPLHALNPVEPCSSSTWATPPAVSSSSTAEARSAAAGAGQGPASKEATQPGSQPSSSSNREQQVQSLAEAVQQQQQLCSDAFAGALLLFQAQELALSEAFDTFRHHVNVQQCVEHGDAWSKYGDTFTAAVKLKHTAQQLGLLISDGASHNALKAGSGAAGAFRELYEYNLEQQHIDPFWHTIADVGESVGASSSSSSSSKASSGGRQYGAWGRRSPGQQEAEDSEVIKAIKAGGANIKVMQLMFDQQGHRPTDRWLVQWWAMRLQRLQAALEWWSEPGRRDAWLKSSAAGSPGGKSSQGRIAAAGGSEASSSGGVFNRLMLGLSGWASSSKQSVEVEDKAQAGEDEDRSSSGGSGRRPGRFDACAGCPLCQEEQASGAAAGAAGSCWPVCWDDPFMWRRLLWQLLGKVKPAAQAFYATNFAMCPHTPVIKLWDALAYGLKQVLWMPPDANPALQQVASTDSASRHVWRPVRLLQYARALNSAFCESYRSPAAALLSQQVLLVLSPLHQQLLPPPEVAPLCPSSFAPAVAQMLMAKLGLGQLLQHDAHDRDTQLQMWHVWWHIGLRRYHWLKQQQPQAEQQHHQQQEEQQQQQQESVGQQLPAANPSCPAQLGGSSSKSSKARKKAKARKQQQQQLQQGLHQLSAAELEQLYVDPDARYYAAGFASRQLVPFGAMLKAQQALSTPHIARSQAVLRHALRFIHHILVTNASAVGGGQVDHRRLLELQDYIMHEQRAELDVFPPMFTPAVQAGGCAMDGPHVAELDSSGWLGDKAGEAVRLMSAGAERVLLQLDPREWFALHDNGVVACDRCLKALPLHNGGCHKVCITCEHCQVASYCSPECQEVDQPVHAFICSHLVAAQQRYAPSSGSSGSKHSLHQASSCSRGGYHWRVLDLLAPDPGPLGTNCQALD